jgi:hypothetical protein
MKRFVFLSIVLLVVKFGMTQSCLPQGIDFTLQSQIDNFQINYPGCSQIEGDVRISGSDITNLNGLSVLTLLLQDLEIAYNPSLTNLTGLDNLTTVGGELYIHHNDALTSLTGLTGLNYIGNFHGKGMVIEFNNSLINLAGLDSLIFIDRYLAISMNNALTSLTGLAGLHSIDGNLYIEYNSSLTSLTGLEGLHSIEGNLIVYEDSSLVSLAGLDNIDAGTISYIQIENNYSLSTCEVHGICDYLAGPNWWKSYIQYNANGCNNIEEIKTACEAIGFESLIPHASLTIYPIPASSFITIETDTEGHLSILNLNGQQLLQHEISEPMTIIDVSTLPPGVHFLKLINNKTVEVGKLIKE